MNNTIKIKRRLTGAAGAPSSLSNGELAFNEVDSVLYYGVGDDGNGNATSIISIAGSGSFVNLTSAQSIAGVKTFSSSPVVPTPTTNGQAANKTYVDTAVAASVVSFNGRTGAITLLASDIPSITASKISDFNTQVRTNRLDQMAVPLADVSLNSYKITNLLDPVNPQDAATRAYVDSIAQGLSPKNSVRVASSVPVTISSPGATVDGVTLSTLDRVLLFGQSTPSENGVYVFNGSSSAMTRSSDADTAAELLSAYVFVQEGSYADSGFVMTTNAPITVGSTALSWSQFSGAGQITAGAGLTKTGNTIDVVANNGIAAAADSIGLTGQALALHNLATNGVIVRTGAATVAARTMSTSGTGISISNGDGIAGNPTVSLTTALSSIGSLTPAADRLPYYSGTSTAALATFTAYGRSLVAVADAATARTTLGLGTIATQSASNVAITGGSVNSISSSNGSFSNVTISSGTISGVTLSSIAITSGTIDNISLDGGSF